MSSTAPARRRAESVSLSFRKAVARLGGPAAVGLLLPALAAVGCGPGVPEKLRPDSVLQAELGLGDDDEVHTVRISGGASEVLEPSETVVPPGAWIEFVTTDAFVHEVRFETDSMEAGARDFLVGSDQVASPPLLDAGARFVISLENAPEGRYPYRAEGNGAPAHGVVVVRPRN